MLINIHRNIMGTVSFDALFPGMRKLQDFIVYPLQPGDPTDSLKVQSDTRMGTIELATGDVRISPPRPGGAYTRHIPQGGPAACRLTGEELLSLKAAVLSTAGSKVGNSVVHTDNSGALEVFGGAA